MKVENIRLKRPYRFTKYFFKVFAERVGCSLDEDAQAYILSVCNTVEPHKKVDDKGRFSEYFTMRVNDKLITVVCDGYSHKIITCVIETHHRKSYEGL